MEIEHASKDDCARYHGTGMLVGRVLIDRRYVIIEKRVSHIGRERYIAIAPGYSRFGPEDKATLTARSTAELLAKIAASPLTTTLPSYDSYV